MTEAILLVACVALAGAVVGLGVALTRLRERVRALETVRVAPDGFVTGASAPSSTSAPVVEEVASAPSSTNGGEEYVITQIGSPDAEPVPVEPPDAKLFADLVLRESVVKAASFAYGVRRGLSPANRNRIWFEMRREVRRARKDRKAEEREAIREWRARQRAAVRDRSRADDAA